MKEINFFPNSPVADQLITTVTVAIRCKSNWIFHQSDLWEIPWDSRTRDETIDDAANRILLDHVRTESVVMSHVGTYCISEKNLYGALFFAETKSLQLLDNNGLFPVIPQKLQHPDIDSKLHDWVQGWINLQNNADELWDIYDENRNLTGRLHRRGDFMKPGNRHLSVHIWMINSHGEFLLTKRSSNKGFPNMWETTGGSALAGDDSLTAALREVLEETGLSLCPDKGSCIFQFKYVDNFTDIWLFRQDFDLADVRLLEGETCDVMYASKKTIRKLDADGLLVPYDYLDKLFEII